MSNLASRCALNFSSKTRSRGSRYASEVRVEIEDFSEREFIGSVRGSGRNRYIVSLAAPGEDAESYGETLFAYCECPHFDRVGAGCKHLWAFILEIDQSGLWLDASGSGDLDLISSDDASGASRDDSRDSDGSGDHHRGDQESSHDRSVVASSASRSDPTRPWQFLASATPRKRTQPRVLHYIARYSTESRWTIELFESPTSSDKGKDKGTDNCTLRRVSLDVMSIAESLSAEDRVALRALAGGEEAALGGAYGSGFYGGRSRYAGMDTSQYEFSDSLATFVLPILATTTRLYWAPLVRMYTTLERADLEIVRWHGDAPLSVSFRLAKVAGVRQVAKTTAATPRAGALGQGSTARGRWQLEVELIGEDAPAVTELDYVGDAGVVVAANLIYIVEPVAQAALLDRLRLDGPLIIEEDSLDDFITFAAPLDLPGLGWPEELGWTTESGRPSGRMSFLKPRRRTPKTMVWAMLSYDYAPAPTPGKLAVASGSAVGLLVARETKRLIGRDLDGEKTLRAELLEQGLSPVSRSYAGEADYQIKRSSMASAVQGLLKLGWEVEAEGVRYAPASSPRLAIKSGIDWFDLEGSVAFGGVEVPLPILLAALERGETTIRLGEGSEGVLPIDWLRRIAPIAAFGQTSEEGLRFAPHQALLLDVLLESQGEVERDIVFSRACRRLKDAGRRKRARAPRGLKAKLRPYQKEGIGWLVHMAEIGLGSCLADDMGLGKTVQALGLLVARIESRSEAAESLPSLVVVPASLVHNWLAEAARFAPGLRLLDYTGSQRASARDRFETSDLIVTTYGTLRRDIEKVVDQRFDVVILDEAQAIKNASTQVSKTARLLRASNRVALSGTPVENHLGELWALFDFLNPGLLGDGRRGLRSLDQASPESVEVIARAVGPFILRRTKSEVLPELPPKTEQTLYCELEGKQKKYYAELRDHYRSSLLPRVERDGLAKSKIQVLEALLRLRQAACHPGLIDGKRSGDRSAKLDLLMERLDQTIDEGHKVLVFSQFTSLLALARAQLDAKSINYESLDGRTRNRGARVDRFQGDPDCRVFLISLKAGGQGLNLTAADYAFLLDPWWNPAAEAQAIDRMHRIGQTRPVFAYRLVARNTIEERILELQDQKRELADALIAGARSGLKALTRTDLERLLE